MRRQIIDLLTAYLMGWKTVRDCAEWIAGIDWNNAGLDKATKALVGEIELLVTEVLEGLRPEAELWVEASKLVAQETGSVYCQLASTEDFIVTSSSNENNVFPGITVPEVVGSQSWNISPLLVSE
jgi:hypothetical protein